MIRVIFFLSFLFLSSRVFSFSSVVGFIDPKDWNVHARITKEAIKPFKFSYISFKHIMAGNVSHDYYPNNVNKAEYHCDRNRKVTHVKAAKACKKAAHYLLDRAVDYMDRRKIVKGLHFFGRSLHVFQDFVSHSNLVDLKKTEKRKAFDFILNKSKKVPNSLKLTGWDYRVKKGEKAGLLKGDFYPHDTFAKDHPSRNEEARSPAKNYKNMNKYEASFQEAVKITAAITTLFKTKVNKKAWEILRLNKHFN